MIHPIELPEGLVVARTAGPFDESTVPAGLLADHRVAKRTWGRLRVLDGSVGFRIFDREVELSVGDEQPIPPEVPHAVVLRGPSRFEVDFLVP